MSRSSVVAAFHVLAKYFCGSQGGMYGLQGRVLVKRAAANGADASVLATQGSVHRYRSSAVPAVARPDG